MTITIIGLGLIGGSLAISLKENGFAKTIIGVDVQAESQDKALRRRIIDEALPLEAAVAKADIIILATPVDSMLKLLPVVLDLIDNQVLMDVGSTKEQLLESIAHHPKRANFIATHPMAGTEYSGIEAAVPNLFDNKYTVFCESEKSSEAAVKMATDLYESIPMNIAFMDAKQHDMHTAYVSHISHISSFALALTVLEKEKDEDRILNWRAVDLARRCGWRKARPICGFRFFGKTETTSWMF